MSKSKRNGGLGFRDVEVFNDAMLAKTSWRIISNPHSLLARMLLGRYCHLENFMEVKAGANISHGWRGILIGRDLLREGMAYAIGDGKKARIWEDPWISIEKPEVLTGPATEEAHNWTVNMMFRGETTEWDEEKVARLFPNRVKDIMKIKPSGLGERDKLCWLFDRFGNYTTKSGYFVALKLRKGTEEEDIDTEFDWRENIWKRKAAPKVQMFLWKAMNRSLPVGVNLLHRQVLSDARCGDPEDTEHVLFRCVYAQNMWGMAPFKDVVETGDWTSLEQRLTLIQNMITLPPVGVSGDTLFACICWQIWISRNKLIFEQRETDWEETCTNAVKEAREWTWAQEEEKKQENIEESVRVELLRNRDENAEEMERVTTDAEWDKRTEKAGLGWRIEDKDGTTVYRRQATRDNVRSALMAEALACLEALSHLRELNRNKVIVSSDSLNLIRALTKRELPMELYGIMQDIETIAKGFEFISFSFIPRNENQEAYELAKLALRSTFQITIVGADPPIETF